MKLLAGFILALAVVIAIFIVFSAVMASVGYITAKVLSINVYPIAKGWQYLVGEYVIIGFFPLMGAAMCFALTMLGRLIIEGFSKVAR